MYRLFRPALFALDAERAHDLVLKTLSVAPLLWGSLARIALGPIPQALSRKAFGLELKSPVGLAAGLDKNASALPFWASLGFGFIEIGTVTAEPQSGNPRPRLFRLVEDRALINRFGFNNIGSEAMAAHLRQLREHGHWPDVPVGANIGKSRGTALENAPQDYALSAKRLASLVDYFTVNVSSPNTPGLRTLQNSEVLSTLLPPVLEAARGTPVLLKLAPDLSDEAIAASVDRACDLGIAGIIATNTTVSRPGLSGDTGVEGGLSGAPLWSLAREKIRVVLECARARVPVVGVGGIHSVEQVCELLDMGCIAVQLLTGLVYEGPSLPAKLNRALAERSAAGA